LGNCKGRLDIIADILRVVSGNAKKTQIIYQANLSYKGLQKYLNEISRASLASFEDKNAFTRSQLKGTIFLNAYQKYSNVNRHLEKRPNDVLTKKNTLDELCSSK
jgi:predicted transcriptional regulator